jgi:ABC-type multidrug transport system fused ATPase/permease subunit
MAKYLLDDYLNINRHAKSSLVTLYTMHASEYGNLFYRMFVFFSLIAQIIFFTVILSAINIYLLFLILLYITLIMFFTQKRGGYALKSGREIANINDKILQGVTEALGSLKITKVLNYEKNIFEKSTSESEMLQKKSRNIYKIKGLLNFIDTFNFIFLMSIMVISYQYFKLPLSEIITFMFLLFRLVPILKQLNLEKIEINSKLESALKIYQFLDKCDQPPKFKKSPKTNSLNMIKIESMSFKFGDQYVLTNVNLTFESSKHYAIMGRSGSGKSSLMNLVLGLYKPTSGNIMYYNKEDKLINVESLHMFYMSQEPFILNGTVRENLLFGLNEELRNVADILQSALRKVDLEVFFDQAQGLDTVIDEDGANLSGGQKQRLALARVFIRHYDLIVLDEHTSAIDQESIKIINEAIRCIQDSTIISITHNSNVINNADEIIELENYEAKSKGRKSL